MIESRVNQDTVEFKGNARRLKDLVGEILNQEEAIRKAGGGKAVVKKGRLTARERIARLTDPGSEFFEVRIQAALEMCEEWGGVYLPVICDHILMTDS